MNETKKKCKKNDPVAERSEVFGVAMGCDDLWMVVASQGGDS